IVTPQRRPPRNDDEEQADFEKEGDVNQLADQKLLPRLDLGKAVDARVDVAIRARIGLQLEANRQRARDLAARFEPFGQFVEQLVIVGRPPPPPPPRAPAPREPPRPHPPLPARPPP